MVREIHGLAGVAKMAVMEGDVQSCTVTDGIDPAGRARVELRMTTSNYPAGMTPEEARFLAEALVMSAQRAERQNGDPADADRPVPAH